MKIFTQAEYQALAQEGLLSGEITDVSEGSDRRREIQNPWVKGYKHQVQLRSGLQLKISDFHDRGGGVEWQYDSSQPLTVTFQLGQTAIAGIAYYPSLIR